MDALTISDNQAESLLNIGEATDPDLESVSLVLAAVRDLAKPGSELDVAALTATAARESRVTPIERFANEHQRRGELVGRIAIAGVTLIASIGLSGGLAHAADAASPGDLLYGLDRALEAVDIANGGPAERLVEVEALLVAERVAEGLDHVAAVLEGVPADDEARMALLEVANRLSDMDGDPAQPAMVSALVDYLHLVVESGKGVDGQTVGDLARDLGISMVDPPGKPSEPGAEVDPPGEPAAPGGEVDPPGKPSEPGAPGKPSEPGAQADPPGKPSEPGAQVDPPGKPSEPGRQSK